MLTPPANKSGGEISLLLLATSLLRRRWQIAGCIVAGAVLSGLTVMGVPRVYRASASIIPQGADASRSGLATLAGQFGVSIPTGNPASSPEFYAKLLQSRVLLLPIIRDTLNVRELGGKRMSFLELLEGAGPRTEVREEAALKDLQGMISIAPPKNTGIMEFSAKTKWRSVSLAIVGELVKGLNDYNERMRQSQATAERTFVEGRLAQANSELRVSEGRLENFRRANREIGSSAELLLERDRIQRDVDLRQQVFTSLMQAYEEARIREFRDTPAITVFEPPWAPTLPESRGRLKRVMFGIIVGTFFGALLALASEFLHRRRRGEDPEVDQLVDAIDQMTARVRSKIVRKRRVT